MKNKQVTYLQNTKPEFKIFKEGMTTNGPVTILSRIDEPFNKESKMAFYLSLGYTVLPL